MRKEFHTLYNAIDSITSAAGSLRQAFSAAGVNGEENGLRALADKLQTNVEDFDAPILVVKDDEIRYTTGGGTEVNIKQGDQKFVVEIFHPRVWYRESTLLASLWLEGYRPVEGELPFEYDTLTAKAVEYVSHCPIYDPEIRKALIVQTILLLQWEDARNRNIIVNEQINDYED